MTTTTTQPEDKLAHAKQSARGNLECIREWVADLNSDDSEKQEAAQQAISEDPLSVQVRGGWYNIGETPEVEEYCILLSTGGPAVRIIGELGRYNEPSTAVLQCQDWFTPWTDIETTDEEDADLLTYVQQFYFGE